MDVEARERAGATSLLSFWIKRISIERGARSAKFFQNFNCRRPTLIRNGSQIGAADALKKHGENTTLSLSAPIRDACDAKKKIRRLVYFRSTQLCATLKSRDGKCLVQSSSKKFILQNFTRIRKSHRVRVKDEGILGCF